MTSSKREYEAEDERAMELKMPLDLFWEVEKLLKKADYLHASNEESTDIFNLYRDVLQKIVGFAVHEKDRVWLYEKLNVG